MKSLGLYKDTTWNGVSFWHGTSDIFLESIRKTGLGTVNAASDLKLLDLLSFLYEETSRKKIIHSTLSINSASIEAAIAQSDIDFDGITLNFRHKNTYVSASALRAATYACLNHVGSELLEKCLILLSILIHSNEDPAIPEELDVLNFRQYLSIQAKPIMIEIRDIPQCDLMLENGDSAEGVLWDMKYAFPNLSIGKQFEKLQFCNFILLKPVPLSSMRIYQVEFEGNISDRNFEYFLTRIN